MRRAAVPRVGTSAFDEEAYLLANPDVAIAVQKGEFTSARAHFEFYGRREGRGPIPTQRSFADVKAQKLARIAPLLKADRPHRREKLYFDFLTDQLRQSSGIDQLGPESSHDYDGDTLAVLDRHRDGLILDVGAGRPKTYFDHVVNFEIAPFDTTDVRGVAEDLPFVDEVFDALISVAVLEHVRDPFLAAREMVRVLKPGGELLCCVPFLQPLHGFPHHYYNMTHEGLRNLFDRHLVVERIAVLDSTLPIWSLTWILRSWSDGLTGSAREAFLDLRVRDLMDEPMSYVSRDWVRGLDHAKNLELASACVLFARKP